MAEPPVAAMVFAAGFGTRMGALTKARPKPLLTLAGRSLLDRALDLLTPLDLPILVNAHYLASQIEAHLADRPGIRVLIEAPQILDTGGGLKHALPHLPEGPVITLNPDTLWQGDDPVRALLAAWDQAEDKTEALLMLTHPDRTHGYCGPGNFAISDTGQLTRDPAGQLYGGLHIQRPARVAQHPADVFSLRDIFHAMGAARSLNGTVYSGHWSDIGTAEGLALAERRLAGDV